MKSVRVILAGLLLAVGVQAAPLRADLYWTARTAEVAQEMGRYARLALQRSQDPAAQARAREQLAQSSAGFHRLAILADSRDLPLPTGPTAAQEKEFESISQLQGAAFEDACERKLREATAALNLCRNQALARTHDPVLGQALQGLDMEAATR